MSDTSFTTSNPKSRVIEAEILINGTPLPQNVQIESIETCHEIDQIPTATVVLNETGGRSNTKGTKTVGDGEVIKIQSGGTLYPLEIKIGTVQSKKTIFKGQCRKKKTGSGQGGAPGTITIEGEGDIVNEDQADQDQHHKEKKDNEVIKLCLGKAAGKVDSTSYKHECLTQMRCSNYKFAKIRSKAVGHVMAPQSTGKMDSVKPKFTSQATYTYGIDIQSEDVNLNVDGVAKKVRAIAWNSETQKNEEAIVTIEEISANSQGPSLTDVAKMNGDQEVLLQSPVPLPMDELKVWAKAECQRRALGRYEGSITVDGNYDLEVNGCVKLEELDDDVNGEAYVTKIEHSYDSHDWNTTLSFGLNPETAQTATEQSGSTGVKPPAAGGQIAGAGSGIQIAKVVNIWEDPKKEHRVQIAIGEVDGDHNKYWARIMSIHASKEFGWYMLPEVGDEVLVIFLNDDPRYPIIIGSMYSKANQMPVKAEGGGDWDGQKDTNNIKGFFSSAGMQMRFQEKDKIFMIDTPGKYFITIDEKKEIIRIEDKTKNWMEFSPKGIEFETPKDFKITAKGNINIEAKQGITVKSGMATKMEAGTTFLTKAATSNTVQGATFHIKGSSFGECKAGLIKIN